MSLESLQAMGTEGIDIEWKDPPPDSERYGLTRDDPDDEPDEGDIDVSDARARINDEAHMRDVIARNEARKTHAQVGQLVERQWREEQADLEREQVKQAAIESASSWDDDDEWYEDDDGQPRIPVATIQAFDRLARMPGVTEDDLREVAEETGFEEELADVVAFRTAEYHAHLDAHERRAMQEHQAQQMQPMVAAAAEFEQLAQRNPGLDRNVALAYATDLMRENAVRIANGQPPLLASVEDGQEVARGAWAMAKETRRVETANVRNAKLHRAFEDVSRSSMLDQRTGESLFSPDWEEVDLGNVFGTGEPTPKQKGRAWAEGAAEYATNEAKRQKAVADERGAAAARATAQQEREIARGLTPKKFNSNFPS